jgi:hypothetical protein
MEEGRHVNPDADYSRSADTQLFDYEVDPLERVNFSGRKEYEAIEEELDTALDWLLRVKGSGLK